MLTRLNTVVPGVVVGTTAAASQEVSFSSYAGGMVHVPTGSSITTITYHVAPKQGATFGPAYDEDGVAVVQTVADGKAYSIPLAVFGAGAIKLVGDAAGVVTLSLKG